MSDSLVLPPRRSRMAMEVTAAIGVAIAVLGTVAGPSDGMAARAPYFVIGGGAYAVGGVLGWLLVRRRR